MGTYSYKVVDEWWRACEAQDGLGNKPMKYPSVLTSLSENASLAFFHPSEISQAGLAMNAGKANQ
jgi:hypothetical protein